jgi:hypothetical protein
MSAHREQWWRARPLARDSGRENAKTKPPPPDWTDRMSITTPDEEDQKARGERPAGARGALKARRATRSNDVSAVLTRSLPVIAIAAAVAGIATYVISKRIPATYKAGVTIAVTVQPTSGVTDAATASNSLASQYAELVTTPAVIDAAAHRLGVPPSVLDSRVSAGTVNAQNLVNISVDGSSPTESAIRANAVAAAFVSFLYQTNRHQAHRYADTLFGWLDIRASVDAARRAVARAEVLLNNASASNRASREAQLSAADATLATAQAEAQSTSISIGQEAAAAQPLLQILGGAGPGSIVAPRPTLYAVIAAVVAALVTAQLIVLFRRRRSAQ